MECSKVSLSKRKFTGKTEEGLPPFYLRSPCDTRHVCTVTGSLFSLRSASSIFFVDRASWHTFPNSDATQSAEEKFAEARSNSVSSNAGRAPNLPLNASEADGVFRTFSAPRSPTFWNGNTPATVFIRLRSRSAS
jgi:hypothetical protein